MRREGEGAPLFVGRRTVQYCTMGDVRHYLQMGATLSQFDHPTFQGPGTREEGTRNQGPTTSTDMEIHVILFRGSFFPFYRHPVSATE